MAEQAWGTNLVHGDGDVLTQGTRIVRREFAAGPNAGTVNEAHNIAAGFTIIRAWVVGSNGRIFPDNQTQVTIGSVNIAWLAEGGVNLSGLTGEGFVEYLP